MNIFTLMIIADYHLQISGVMNDLSHRMSIEKSCHILFIAIQHLVSLEVECDIARARNKRQAYDALYDSWWNINNARICISRIRSARMQIEMESVVGGGN